MNIKKKFRLLFSAVISEHFSKNYMIISVVAAKIQYLENVRFLLGHPVLKSTLSMSVSSGTSSLPISLSVIS